ncbi:MAG: tetratricopeptide repeat protein [Actinobacteria bacterium]|nr:tetratricopeptide repeat protein [Actinomycetota bacterium]
MRRKPASPEVATPAEVWENMKRVPLGIFQVITFPATWLCFALIILLGALYVLVPALLLSYLPSRLFGATKGTFGLDLSLGILLSIIGGLFIWGKVNRSREKKRLADKVDSLRQRNGELQTNLIRVIEEKGRNHPETGYVYRELGKNMEALGQSEQARQVHLQEREIFRETLGAASPEASYWKKLDLDPPVILPKPEVTQVSRTACGELEIFDARRTLISIFGMLLGVSVMSAVLIGFGFAIELFLSIFK